MLHHEPDGTGMRQGTLAPTCKESYPEALPVLRGESQASGIPLCVDLDGTLVQTDTLAEGLFALAADRRLLWCLAALIFSGRAAFKQQVADAAVLDMALLPFNQELLDYLRSEKAAGRTLILATAADAAVAQAVADHLNLFDEVIASDGVHNLKGSAKAAVLVRRLGERGFAYAGDSRADLPVWQRAQSAVVVNAGPRLSGQVRRLVPVDAEGEPGKLFICSTPRSGSYLPCRYMINAGLGSTVAELKWRPRRRMDRLRFGNPAREAEERFLAQSLAALIPKRC